MSLILVGIATAHAVLDAWSGYGAYVEWLRGSGAYINDKLIIGTHSAFVDGRVKGVFLREGARLEALELLAVIPPELMFSGGMCAVAEDIDAALRNASDHRQPWLDIMRDVFDPPSAALPNYWHKYAKELLRGLPPYDIERHEEAYRWYCKPEASVGSKWSDDRWLAARRAFLLQLTRSTSQFGADDSPGSLSVVPFFDAFNHCGGDCENVGMEHAKNGSMLLHAHKDVVDGSQLFLFYTGASPDLLRDYGFVSARGGDQHAPRPAASAPRPPTHCAHAPWRAHVCA